MIAGNQIWFDLRTSLTSLSFPCYSPGCFFLFVVLPSTQCFFLFLVDGRYEIWIPKWRQHNTWYIYIHTHKSQVLFSKTCQQKGDVSYANQKSPPLLHLLKTSDWSTPRWSSHQALDREASRYRESKTTVVGDSQIWPRSYCWMEEIPALLHHLEGRKACFFLTGFQLPSSAGDRRISEPSTVSLKCLAKNRDLTAFFFWCQEWLKMEWIDQKGILIRCSVLSHETIVWDKQQQQQPQ